MSKTKQNRDVLWAAATVKDTDQVCSAFRFYLHFPLYLVYNLDPTEQRGFNAITSVTLFNQNKEAKDKDLVFPYLPYYNQES